jgi:hypothetical protein
MTFYYFYNYDDVIIAYHTIENIYETIYHVNLYNEKNKHNVILYLLYNCNIDVNKMLPKNEHIKYISCDKNLYLFLHLHYLRHNYFYKNKKLDLLYDVSKIHNLHDLISVKHPTNNRSANDFKKKIDYSFIINKFMDICNDDEIINSIQNCQDITTINYYNEMLNKINKIITDNVPNIEFDFINYANSYIFKMSSLLCPNYKLNNFILENVYYINKQWFDIDKKLIYPCEFYNDCEYPHFLNSNHIKLHNDIIDKKFKEIIINEEVVYLDYIYAFYNFGEFWDCIRRLLPFKGQNKKLFCLKHSRVTNIDYYFNNLQLEWKNNYDLTENNDILYFFKKINISTIIGSYRGYFDNNVAYNFNTIYNKIIPTTTINLYLTRGKYGRTINGENKIIDILVNKYNFIIIDGSEPFYKLMYYFTNANIILGAHGSLMKNIIWAKNNPILIELCPISRQNCFYGNSYDCGFTAFFFWVNCDDNENILLNDIQINGLYELLDCLM